MSPISKTTIEVSGQLGYELKEDKKPITRGDFKSLMNEVYQMKKILEGQINDKDDSKVESNIFKEIKIEKYEGNKNEP